MPKLNIDIDKLQKETESAIRAGEIEAEIAERKRKEREERKRLMDELKSQRIVDQISARCARVSCWS